MTRFGVALSYIKSLLRVFAEYEFVRSILVGAARDTWGNTGAVIVFDLVSVLIVAWFEDDKEYKWPIIVASVALTEIARVLVTTPHVVHVLSSSIARWR